MAYFNLNELTSYIKMSKSSAYKLTMANQIPFIKRGKKLLFKKEAIDQWLEQYAQPTVQELKNNCINLLKTNKNGNS